MGGPTISRYRVIEKLGAGGMGEVWRAHDTQLDRDVALKVLPAEQFADETARARLVREARIASRLNHPHICTIHEVGESDGQAYIAMELVEGRTLSARLLEGPLATGEVVRVGWQIADAVAHAHEKGVVHRDLKSANVILTPEGRVKVLDFGLAKRMLSEVAADAPTQTMGSLSAPGRVVGTLAYIAPEQLREFPADTRSDVWSLGVMLYEMAAGRRPFQGKSCFDLSSAILREAPPPLPGPVPGELGAVITRCLSKEPAQRYAQAGELRAALEAIGSGMVAPWAGWRYDLSRRHWLVSAGAVGSLLALGVFGLRERLWDPRPAMRLAVLPFVNLSGDTEQEYLSDGMTQEMIAQLGGLHPARLSVIARTSVMRYKKSDKPVEEVGRELKVDYILEGSARREGSRIRITAELIQVKGQTQLWAETYEREMAGVLALQSEVARKVASSLALKLLPAEQGRMAKVRQFNPEAYDAYLKGEFHKHRLTEEHLDKAEGYFQSALERDPSLALGHVGIASTWLVRGHLGFMPPREALMKAKPPAQRALELDETLVEAHGTRAAVAFYLEWDWDLAERHFRRALELDPNDAQALATRAAFLAAMERWEGAREGFERAIALDPYNSFYPYFFGCQLIRLRRYEESIAELQKVAKADPGLLDTYRALSSAFHLKAMHKESLAALLTYYGAAGDHELVDTLERAGRRGDYTAAMLRLAEALAVRYDRSYVLPTTIAGYYVRAGDRAQALNWLERAHEDRDTILVYLKVSPGWDDLRAEPRFQALLRKMKL